MFLSIADGTWTTPATVTHAVIQEWSAENAIVGLGFDTTELLTPVGRMGPVSSWRHY